MTTPTLNIGLLIFPRITHLAEREALIRRVAQRLGAPTGQHPHRPTLTRTPRWTCAPHEGRLTQLERAPLMTHSTNQ